MVICEEGMTVEMQKVTVVEFIIIGILGHLKDYKQQENQSNRMNNLT